MRRRAPVILVALGIALLLGWYVAYTQRVVRDLRVEAGRQSRTLARVFRAFVDTGQGAAAAALQDVVIQARASGVPMIATDPAGNPTAAVNLPFEEDPPGPRTRAHIAVLDRRNPPIVEPGFGTVHYGDSPLVQGLAIVPLIQTVALLALLGAGVYVLLLRGRAEREHVWAGMARESAHQLGTPLTSLSGWIALLEDEVAERGARANPLLRSAVVNMQSDLERLERVAHRFERIGRPPRRDRVDVAALVDRITSYFRARVPTRAHAVTLTAHRPDAPLEVDGDAVLLEWVLEALTKNAVDALAGRGGRIEVSAERLSDGSVRLRVVDDGPGIPRELRRRIFDAGFSTKERGWGIGLSLARRIVEENHGGRLTLAPSDRGAAFEVILS
jgi:signal transduction histidine kinase